MRFSFKTIAIIVATAMSFYTILAVILYVIHEFYPESFQSYFRIIIGAIVSICILVAFIAILLYWINLSIVAFRRLPNPIGYRIFNITCQVLTLGGLVLAVFAPNGIDMIFGTIFFLSSCAFVITTNARMKSFYNSL